jgi:outer membrane protein assembly factor BamD
MKEETGKDNFRKSISAALRVTLFIVILANGCSWWQKKEPEPTPQALYENAMNLFQKKKYEKAAEACKKFKEEFPLSEYTPQVELRIADAYFFQKKYAEAIVLYEEFRKLHPMHPEISYAVYQLGMCHVNQMLSLDRDQTETEKAIEQFRYLIENYPQSPQAEDGKKRMQVCRKQMADHEFYIGDFYFRTKKYRAALGRFEGILQKYPECGLEEKIKPLVAKCQSEIAEEEQKRKEKESRAERKRKEQEDKKKVKQIGTEKSG